MTYLAWLLSTVLCPDRVHFTVGVGVPVTVHFSVHDDWSSLQVTVFCTNDTTGDAGT